MSTAEKIGVITAIFAIFSTPLYKVIRAEKDIESLVAQNKKMEEIIQENNKKNTSNKLKITLNELYIQNNKDETKEINKIITQIQSDIGRSAEETIKLIMQCSKEDK